MTDAATGNASTTHASTTHASTTHTSTTHTSTTCTSTAHASARVSTGGPTLRALTDAVNFIHLSDPHLTSLADVDWRELRGKRVLGYLSWRQKRRQVHQRAVLDAVTVDALSAHPDHIAVTGDLTHIGLAAEHRAALTWLEHLGNCAHVSLAPGNHDVYGPDSHATMTQTWGGYVPQPDLWPSVRDVGQVRFISLCSGTPSRPLFAAGALGDLQLAKLREVLLAAPNMLRVVLVHHSPHPDSHPPRKKLRDRGAFTQVLADTGAELILHGHSHRATLEVLAAGNFRIPVLGAPSASTASTDPSRAGGYHRVTLGAPPPIAHDGKRPRWLASIETRRWTPAGMISAQRQELFLG